MTSKPRHRELCAQYLDALKEYTDLIEQEESDERRNIQTSVQETWDAIDNHILYMQEDQKMLGSAIVLLQLQKATLQRRKARTQNALQPICNLPDEILTHIFEIGVPVPSEQWLLDPRENLETRWTFGQFQQKLHSVRAVCGRFRIAVLNSPRCWTYVTYKLQKDKDERPRLEALDTMLRRSKGVPFNLRLKISTKAGRTVAPPSASSLQEVTRVLLPHIHRCERLYLECDNRGADFPVLTGPMSPLNSLRYITFDWNDDEQANSSKNQLDSKAGQSILSLLSKVEQPLLSLTINGLFKPSQRLNADFLAFQVHALTRLRLDARCRTLDAVTLLRRCTSLEHLFWAPQKPSEGDDYTASPLLVSLEKLISLRVDSDVLPCILLYAPRLEQATLMYGDSFDLMNPSQPALPSLRRLSLYEPYSNVSRMAAFVRRHPRLAELETSNITHLSAVVDSLMATPTDAKDAVDHPYLRRLSLRTSWRGFLERPKAVESVQSLLRKHKDLRVYIHFKVPSDSPTISEENAKTLKQFENEFASRIEIEANSPRRLSDTWRDAWGEWQKPGYW